MRVDPDTTRALSVMAVVACALCAVVVSGAQDADPRQVAADAYNRAVKQHDTGQTEEAVNLLQQALAAHAEFAEAHNLLGTIQMGKGDLTAAEKSFREAVRINPKYALGYNNLGALLLKRGLKPDALGAFEQAARLDPRQDMAFHNIALILQANGKIKLATRYYLQAIRANHNNTNAMWRVGNIYREASLKKEAEIVFSRLARVSGHDPKAVVALSQLYASQGMLAAAAGAIDDAVKAGASSPRLDEERARVLLLSGLVGEAEKEYRKIVSGPSATAAAHTGLAAAILAAEKPNLADALANAKRAVAMTDSQDARALYTQGLVKQRMGDETGAQFDFMMAAQADPSHVQTQVRLGVIAARAKRFDKAVGYFAKAVELAPDDLSAKYRLARTRVQGNVDYARGVRLLGEIAKDGRSGHPAAVAAAELLKKIADHARSSR